MSSEITANLGHHKTHKTDVHKTLIGIDYGDRNMGIALGKNGLVAPLKIVSGKDTAACIHELIRVALENKAEGYVVGIPLTADGRETNQSTIIKNFCKILKIRSKKPVFFHNEYGTSQEATEEALSLGYSKKGRGLSDHLAAALTLKRYYDSLE